jgi:copper chaperone CopZ
MTTEYKFSYLPCEFCVGKNHCVSCADEIARLLTARPGVQDARVNRPEHTLILTHEGIDLDDLEDAMDAAGVFLS